MKAIRRSRNNYNLKGTDLKYLGEKISAGSYIEEFGSKNINVLRSIEKENGRDCLTISFSSRTNKPIDKNTLINYAEHLGLDKEKPFEISSHPCIFNGVQIITYIFQDCIPASKIYS